MVAMENGHFSGQGNLEYPALVRVRVGEDADLEPDHPHHPV